jgi:hypothetical protein
MQGFPATPQNSAQSVVDFSKGKLSFVKKKIISFVATNIFPFEKLVDRLS